MFDKGNHKIGLVLIINTYPENSFTSYLARSSQAPKSPIAWLLFFNQSQSAPEFGNAALAGVCVDNLLPRRLGTLISKLIDYIGVLPTSTLSPTERNYGGKKESLP